MAILALLAAACGAGASPAPSGPAASPLPASAAPATASPASAATLPPRPRSDVLVDLRSLDDLKERFNQDRGTPRLILLFSPT